MSAPHVAVIGGGFTGTLLAINLLRSGARATLIDRSPRPARGVAYGTRHADHLLNVRASGMSAFPDDPGHFARWLEARDGRGAGSFAERRLYGTYLEELLAAASAEAGERLTPVKGEAVDVVAGAAGETVVLADGGRIEADAVVLAIGNLAPEAPRGIDPAAMPEGVYAADPWTCDIAAGLSADDKVVLIGTGLTAVDAALMLDSAGFRGQVLALSRRGLVPRRHADAAIGAAGLEQPPVVSLSQLTRRVRADAERIGWRAAVDKFRPVTQPLWAAASVAERGRFLRHLRPYWDVHRHRLAPSIARRIERLEAEGRLRFAAGRIVRISNAGSAAEVTWRPRSLAASATLTAARIVNCTGPQADIARAGEPLLETLLRSGRIRPDPLRIGIDVEGGCRTLDTAGAPARALYAAGPITKGALWEIVAVPDIRGQVAALAAALANPR